MPRPLRLHVRGAFHLVTLRGNHRQDIFFKRGDRDLFTDLLAEMIQRFGARVHAYCLMTNHVHLLIQVGDAPLGRIMLRVASQYARIVQKRFSTTGHLFERRYHAILVDADEYLLELLRYIHLNPVRAHIVRHVDEYPWSSHHAYMGMRTEAWVTTQFALRMFHAECDRAISAYRAFVLQQVGMDSESPLQQCNPNDPRVLGSDDFVGRLLNESWRPRSRVTLAELIAQACQQLDVTAQALQSRSRNRKLTQARAWIAHQATTHRIASIAEVARTFNRNEASLRESVLHHFHRSARDNSRES